METVKFNSIDEFLKELEREKGNIDRRIVRVTGQTVPGKLPPIYHLSLIGTALVIARSSSMASAGEQVIRLDKYCGPLFIIDGKPTDHSSEEVHEKGRQLAEELKDTLQKMGFDVRPGIIEPECEP